LGSHVGQQLLRDCPEFNLRCSVRNQKKADVLKKTFNEYFEKISWVNADLNNAEDISKSVEGCKYVVHVASPIPGANAPSTNDFMIKVA
jgi:nucleoside-diphosphate-sugar epimerase